MSDPVTELVKAHLKQTPAAGDGPRAGAAVARGGGLGSEL